MSMLDRAAIVHKPFVGRFRGANVIVTIDDGLWHLSIAGKRSLPLWATVRDARYEFIPHDITMAMLLPPPEQYVNVHEYCFHLWEVDDQRKGGLIRLAGSVGETP